MGRDSFFRTSLPTVSVAVAVTLLLMIIVMYAELVETYRLTGEARYQLAELQLEWLKAGRASSSRDDSFARLDRMMAEFSDSSMLARAGKIHPLVQENLLRVDVCWNAIRAARPQGVRLHGCEDQLEVAFGTLNDWIEEHLPRQSRAFRIVLRLLLLVIVAFGVLVFWLLRRLYRAQIGQERSAELTAAVLRAQDTERKMIALDIHDGALQTLSAAKIAVDSREGSHRVSALLGEAVGSLRDLAAGLSLYELEQTGLESALRSLVDQARSQHQLPVVLQVAGIDSLDIPMLVASHVYRIVQELLTNARKHAQASTVRLSVTASWPDLIVRYEDDGLGIAGTRNNDSPPTLGWRGINERSRMMNASIRVDGNDGKGTRVRLAIPLGRSDDPSDREPR